MVPPRTPALDWEAAMALLAELQAMEERLRRLRDGLERLLEEGGEMMADGSEGRAPSVPQLMPVGARRMGK